VEVNSYRRPWFLRALAASPLFVAAFLHLFSWQVGHGVGPPVPPNWLAAGGTRKPHAAAAASLAGQEGSRFATATVMPWVPLRRRC
jgi:hypothetical protein